MDVVRLSRTGATPTYQPDKLLEGFSSKIWTERYRDPSDFELHTPNIAQALIDIPERSLLSLIQSNEVMMVDSRDVIIDPENGAELVIKGTSLTNFSKNRVIKANVYGRRFQMAYNYTVAQAAEVLLWNAFVNTDLNDVVRATAIPNEPKEAIPNVIVTDSVNSPGSSKRRWLEQGTSYEKIDAFLASGKLGVRTIRPSVTSTGKKVTIDTTGANRGTYSIGGNVLQTALQFNVYDGLDRTKGQNARTAVIFNYYSGDLDNPEYLWDTTDFVNNVTVVSSEGTKYVARVAADKNLTGLDRIVFFLDGGSPDDGQNKADFFTDIVNDGQNALAEHDKKSLFSADISPTAGLEYRVDYFLGDRVTLQSQYDDPVSGGQDMYVTEYTMTEDREQGERGFPGLTLPSDMDDTGT